LKQTKAQTKGEIVPTYIQYFTVQSRQDCSTSQVPKLWFATLEIRGEEIRQGRERKKQKRERSTTQY